MKCKITGEEIEPFMTFGKMPLANAFLNKKDFNSEFFYEMEVGFSKKLSLFQLNEFPSPEKIFNNKYPFYSGSSEYMKLHFKKYAEWLQKEFLQSNLIRLFYFAFLFMAISIAFAKPILFALNPIYDIAAIVVVFITIRSFLKILGDSFTQALQGIEEVDTKKSTQKEW